MNEFIMYLSASFGLLFLVWIIINPFVGLSIFTVFLYLKPGSLFPFLGSVHTTRIIAILTLVIFLLQGKRRSVQFIKSPQTKWMLLLILMMFTSMITSIWYGNTLDFILGFFKVLLGYFLVINLIDTRKRFNAIIWVMLLTSLYIAVMSIINHFSAGGDNLGTRMYGFFAGSLFADPNDLALSFIILLPYAYYGLFQRKILFNKIVLLSTMGVFMWGIILTQSRGGLIGFIAIVVVTWIRAKKKLFLLLFLAIFIAAGWQIIPDYYRDRIMSIQTAASEDESAMIRLGAWKASFNMMKSNVFGVGVGNFGEGFVYYRPMDAIDPAGMRRAAHNMFLELGGETGFPGLLVFLCLLASSFISLNNTKKECLEKADDESREISLLSDATFVSLAGFCASGIFLSQSYNWILYYLIAFSVVLKIISENKDQE